MRIFLHILRAVVITQLIFPFSNRYQRERLLCQWSQGLLGILNIDFSVSGSIPRTAKTGYLLVSNHISWLDINLIHAVCPARFIAKSDIRRWPIFGALAVKSGTLFIKRHSKKGAAAMVKVASQSLRHGDLVACFPEGTTSDGHRLLPFHGSLLQASIDCACAVIPLCIRYLDTEGKPDLRMAFLGETTLLQSIGAILALPHGRAELHILPEIPSQGHDRRGLTLAVQHAIAHHLKALQSKSES